MRDSLATKDLILKTDHTLMTLPNISNSQPNSNRNQGLQQVPDALLGNTTGIVSAPPQFDSWKLKIDSNRRKWTLKRYAESLMPKSRTSFCMRQFGRNSDYAELYYNSEIQNAHYQGLAHCDNVWCCPVCSATVSARRVAEIQTAINNWSGSTVMLTYTLSHKKNDDPLVIIDNLRNALRDMYKDRAGQHLRKMIGWFGTITNLDITYGKINGWHIHVHQLVFLNPENASIDVMDDEAVAKYINWKFGGRWQQMLEKYGESASDEHGFRCTAGEQFNREYVAKFGRLPKDTAWTIANEVAQSNAKRHSAKLGDKGLHPFQVLELSRGKQRSYYGKLWQIYVDFTKGRNNLTWSPGLKKHFGIDDYTDDEIIELAEGTPEGKQLICKLPRELWGAILFFDKRAELLNMAIRYAGERLELEAWFDEIRAKNNKRFGQSVDRSSVPDGTIWDYQGNNAKMDNELHDWSE